MVLKDERNKDWSPSSLSEQERASIRRLAESDERLRLTMTNDFAFRTVFRNTKALKGLLSAVLKLPAEELVKIKLVDPVMQGDFIEDKQGVLDIRVRLNDNRKINIEMQVLPFPFWEERSLFYLCKLFLEGLTRGNGYGNLEPCIHVGILKYDLYESEDYYSEISLIDRKSGRLYSDKISLRVLQLNQLEKATQEQQQEALYLWAMMISADDWEVLEMLAKKNAYIEEAVKELEKINSDPVKRYEYLCREKKELDENTIRNYFMGLGRDEGEAEGLAKGEAIGIAKGEAAGITKGEAAGIAKGEAAGIAKGEAAGIAKGKAAGIAKGKAESEARYSRLILKLSETGELGDIVKAASDPGFLDQLYLKYSI